MKKRAKHIPKNRRCYHCGKNTYRNKQGFYQWHNYRDANGNDNHLCVKCYCRIVVGTKYYHLNRKRYRAVQRAYYLRVTKPKLERKKELIVMGVD